MNAKHKLLIVEDEQAILQGLIDVFVFHGFEVDAAENGKIGLEKALTGNWDYTSSIQAYIYLQCFFVFFAYS